MDEKDWAMFMTIVEEKSITQAAEKLYISQPALSYRLKNLETEIGANLIIRTSNGILLTPQGEAFLKYVENMRKQSSQIRDYIKGMGSSVQGTLHIGCSGIFAHYELAPILKDFLQQYPMVEVNVRTGLSHKVMRMLEKEEITVAILRGSYPWTGNRILIQEEPICLVNKEPITFEELPKHPRISYLTDQPLLRSIEAWIKENFKNPLPVTMQLDSMDTCRQFVLNGLGWSILPYMGLSGADDVFTQRITFKDGTPLTRKTEMLYHKEAMNLSAVKAFIYFLTERYKNNCKI